jgi:hypothetical protein
MKVYTFITNAQNFPKELCFLQGFQVLPACLSDKSNIWLKMSVEH